MILNYLKNSNLLNNSNLFTNLFRGMGTRDTKILMVGLDAAGKTTILYRFKIGEVISSTPTIGFNVETLKYKRLNLTVWDVGGQAKIRPLWRHYFQNADGIIYVIDSSDTKRMEEAALELRQILKENEIATIPVLVYANKQDEPGALRVEDIISKMDLHSERARRWHVQSSCAITGDGLYEGLDWLAGQIIGN